MISNMELAELMVTRRAELISVAVERLPESIKERVIERIVKSKAGEAGVGRVRLARIDDETLEITVDDEVIFHGNPFRLLEEGRS